MDLKGKNVFITGASQGLGASIAHTFAERGGRVFVNFASSATKADAVVAEIREKGGIAEPFQCDVSNEEITNEKMGALQKKYGGIDILINNARLDPYKRSEGMSDAEWWDWTMAVNLKGAYLTTLAVIDGMKERKWGRIINVSSVWAHWPAKRAMVPYSVSKAGMHALTRAFALDGAPYVSVNTVAPGLIMTENAAKRLTPEQLQAETDAIPLARGGTPEEISKVILDTACSGFITGESINVNGGAYMGN